jgi:hypothetical protein
MNLGRASGDKASDHQDQLEATKEAHLQEVSDLKAKNQVEKKQILK